VSKRGVSPDGSLIRLRQHGTFISFSQKICTLCKFFVKKNEIFHPAGGASSQLSRQTPGLQPTA
jgi:hypothetical protein